MLHPSIDEKTHCKTGLIRTPVGLHREKR